MKVWAFARSKRVLQGVSMALVLSLAATVALPVSARAEAENSLFSQLRGKKKGTPATTTTTTGHTQGSGIPATTETAIINDGSVAPFITPDSGAAIQALADRYAKIVADGGWPEVPRGRTKKGSKGKPVAVLNKRLYIEGYLRAEATEGEYADLFTSATEDALKRFQANHGLAPTGVMDGVTLEALNVSAAARLATIRANIPRLAEYSKNLGNRYVVVNVPAQQIETVNDGKVYSIHNAIVGRPSRPTPVVETPLTIVRFNPYWNAPASIVARDIVPRMISRGPSKVMADMNMKVFKGVGGPEINPDTVDWRRAKVDDYHFRQEPGGDNAMATAKVEFNSPFGIYLHDTPEPQLFSTSNRFYSSGCVRVQKVAILLNWILQGQDGINEAKIANLAETKERLDVNIANAPQLRVAYLTAWPAKDGVAAFRSDIYDMDGSGFVVGQPLPVGEKMDGQRFVLKPIPYLQEDIDTDNGGLFASLFRGRSSENEVVRPGQNKTQADALVKIGGTPANNKQAAGKQVTAKTKATTTTLAKRRWQGSGKDELAATANTSGTTMVIAPKSAKKPVQKKTAQKATAAKTSKTASAKTPAGKTATASATQKAGAKPVKVAKADAAAADPKAKTAAKPATSTATAAAAKPAAPAKAAAPATKPAAPVCKAGSDGKMPAGCPAPAASAKPAAAPAKTANAAN